MTRRIMHRGKQQVMYGLLPGKMFDFQGSKEIARVKKVEGEPDNQLNLKVILKKIEKDAHAWHSDFRPDLSDEFLHDGNNFVLLDPTSVEAELFPKILLCQNRFCGHINVLIASEKLDAPCKKCNQKVSQLTFIKVHQCGALSELKPPTCSKCHNSYNIALDTRNSERLTNFRWVCRKCRSLIPIDSTVGKCIECVWPDSSQQRMKIQKFRAGSTFYPRNVSLLNIPEKHINKFLDIPDWELIVAAKFMGLIDIKLSALAEEVHSGDIVGGVTDEELRKLSELLEEESMSAKDLLQKARELSEQRKHNQANFSMDHIIENLREETGVLSTTWQMLGQELLEAIVPFEENRYKDLFSDMGKAPLIAKEMKISRLALLSDFPMLTVSYGYTRTSYEPSQCYLKPFPSLQEHKNKYPIFIDRTQADALWISLDSENVWDWLVLNGLKLHIPPGKNNALSKRGYFAHLFAGLNYKITLDQTNKEARMVFGLLHTLSHLCIRKASLLCGLDITSLGEYLLPSALTFAISSNHRSGATIGALTALFEQVPYEWLSAVKDSSNCVYDPVCYEQTGNCHACTHLAETSCSNFNLNLGRAFLFGGYDVHLGEIKGFFGQ
jgi:hypothetical protein